MIAPIPTRVLTLIVNPRPAPAAPRRQLPPLSSNDLLDRRVDGYLARVGPRRQGSRNDAAFTVAAWLTRNMALPLDIARPYLARWNATNLPPLDDAELESVLKSAVEHGKHPIGAALDDDAEPWEINLRRALGGTR